MSTTGSQNGVYSSYAWLYINSCKYFFPKYANIKHKFVADLLKNKILWFRYVYTAKKLIVLQITPIALKNVFLFIEI